MVVLPADLDAGAAPHLAPLAGRVPFGTNLDPWWYGGVDFIFLCFTSRCGSNLVAQGLASDGQLNEAAECWNGEHVAETCRVQSLADFGQYFGGTVRFNARSGRLLSKLSPANAVLLQRSGFLDLIWERSRFILVDRSDKLGQAISLALAAETAAWAWDAPGRVPAGAVEYGRGKVERCLEGILAEAAAMARFLAVNGAVPFHLDYEQFCRDPQAATAATGREFGLALQYVPRRVRLRRQAGAVNELWRTRFLRGD